MREPQSIPASQQSVPPPPGAGLDAGSQFSLSTKLANIMIVDDEEYNILVVRRHLREAGYEHFTTTTDPTSALSLMWEQKPDLVLLDVMMPGITGLELLQLVRGDEKLARLPVIILTASSEAETKLQALELGATDFLAKPVDASELVLRIRNSLLVKEHQDRLSNYSAELEREVHRRTAELEASQREVVYCLARAGESRDTQTGQHVHRVSRYAGILALQLGFPPAAAEKIEIASQLHDVGKIAISDSILLKPGRLSDEEFELMKRHCEFGVRIIQAGTSTDARSLKSGTGISDDYLKDCESPLMKLAAKIAASHHEKWDGTGYPRGLAGEDIPIEGRITAVADVFDALTSERPYKESFPLEKAFAILLEGRGKHFDPDVIDAFFARRDDILEVMINYVDE